MKIVSSPRRKPGSRKRAVSLDGRMIDIAKIRMAQRRLRKADAIAATRGER